jgi:peptidyl-prolyl cis-trans isomerase C
MMCFFARTIRIALALAAAILLAACGQAPQQGAADTGAALQGAPDGSIVAVVNGESVTQPVLEAFARMQGLDAADPAQRQQALDALVENMVLAQAALAGPLGQQVDVQAEAALARMQQLSGRQVQALSADIQIPEQELLDYYRRETERSGTVEYQAQHILFADAAAAAAALAEATAPGADFSALMSKYQDSALQARDLGWANLAQTPKEFAELLPQLADGEVAPVVVQTRFGHHLLRRVASRPFTPPPFEQVREGVRAQLANQALAERVRALRATAEVAAPGASPGAGTQ